MNTIPRAAACGAVLLLAASLPHYSPHAPLASSETVQVSPAFAHLTFDAPVFLTSPPDGTDRLFVLENGGRILALRDVDSVASSRVFLDISARLPGGDSDGLVGMAFDPDFTTNGYAYVMYGTLGPRRSVLSRFTVSGSDPDVADPDSELVILEVPEPHQFHNGATVTFGPDGMLYAGFGDGGGEGDPFDNGQDTTDLHGTIIRIDPHGGTPYAIPQDNPFVGNTDGTREEIWAYGFRNPWRFSFDQETGALWAADVGELTREEIDVVVPGGNYGWPIYEGTLAFRGGQPSAAFESPVHDYGRAAGISVIGGMVYRGDAMPWLQGSYLYADFGPGSVRALGWNGTSVTSDRELAVVPWICSFGEDRHGEVYAISYLGTIAKLVPTGEPAATFAPFGAGCAGTAGEPGLLAAPGSLPWLGETLSVELSGLPPASTTFGVLGMSTTEWGGIALPRDLVSIGMPGCTQYISVDFSAALQNDNGTATWDIDLPPGTNLIGVRFRLQGLVLDPGANAGGAILTNAAEAVIAAW